MPRKLPPLKSLVAFEAAARHGSFTRAAEELHVTQGAVSRHVGQLEKVVGCSLFERANRQVTLTARGDDYARSVRRALDIVDEATDRLVDGAADGRITLVTSTAVAALWLLPLIARFKARHGESDIRLLARDTLEGLAREEFDLAVFYASTAPSGWRVQRLFAEEVICVCSPEYFTRHHDPEQPLEILRTTQLSCDLPGQWVQWPDWFEHIGIEEGRPRSRLEINNHVMVLQAAVDGQGIALAWRGLVDPYLESGQLVLAVDESMVTGGHFYLLGASRPVRRPAGLDEFEAWLMQSSSPLRRRLSI